MGFSHWGPLGGEGPPSTPKVHNNFKVALGGGAAGWALVSHHPESLAYAGCMGLAEFESTFLEEIWDQFESRFLDCKFLDCKI